MELNRFIFIAALYMIVSMPMLSFIPLECADQMIRRYVADSKTLRNTMGQCEVPRLNGTVVIHFVQLSPTEWAKKNNTVRVAEILSHLRMLSGAMALVDVHAMPDCANGSLKNLAKNIEAREMNLIRIIKEHELKPDSLKLEDSKGKNTSKVFEIFQCYYGLMAGKIQSFLKGLQKDNCPPRSR